MSQGIAKLPKLPRPARSYLHRNQVKIVPLPVRIPEELKQAVDRASDILGTSNNHLVESAVQWYLDALKREGAI